MPVSKGIALVAILFSIDRLTKIATLVLLRDAVTLNPKTFFIFDASLVSVVFLIVLVSVLGWWFLREMSGAAALIFAGAFSNLFDRLRYGAVIDWITLPPLTVFNLADSFIVLGCVLTLISFFTRKKV